MPRRPASDVLVLSAALLLAVSSAPGQTGPVTITSPQDYRALVIEELEAALRFEYRYNADRTEPEDQPTQKTTEHDFREILELATVGFAGHPNLLKFDARGELWFEQNRINLSPGDDQRSDALLLNYDVRGTIFGETKLPFTLYARQNINDIDRQFGGRLEYRTIEYGAALEIRSDVLPTHVEAFRREERQSDSFGDTEFRIDQNTVAADGRGVWADNQQFWWDFTYDDIEESGDLRALQDFDRIQANATHVLLFGNEAQHELRSDGRFYREGGTRDIQRIRSAERLRFRHSDTLRTRLEYIGDFNDRPDFDQQRHQFLGDFRHQLFDSLVTTGTGGYRHEEIDTEDYTAEEIFGEIVFDYTKQAPGGVVYAGAAGLVNWLDETDRGARVQVFDRLFVFDASGSFFINQRNVDPASISVRDASGLIVYTENVDYTVLATLSRVQVQRVLGGDIAPGAAVLVDYAINPEPGGDTTTLGLGLELRYTLEDGPLRGLSVYGRFFTQDENRTLEELDGELFPENDYSQYTFGTEYTRGPVYLKAEHQIRDGSFDPYDATRLEARYRQRLGRSSLLLFNALYLDIDRRDDDIRTETLSLSGQWTQQIGRNLRASALLLWQNQNTNAGSDSEGWEQEVTLRWQYGQTELYTRFRNSIRNNDFEDTMFQTLFVGLRREF